MADTILITGANRGIGLELSRQYAAAGWRVYSCCRSLEAAHALNNLASTTSQGEITVHLLDVTNATHISAMSNMLEGIPIDVLFNNAGTYGQADACFGNTDEAKWLDAFRINTIAPLKMMETFAVNVAKSEQKIIVAMSSKMGSMEDNTSGGSYVYRSSKAALNSAIKSAAIDLRPRDIKVVSLHPGWVMTDMGGANALISAEECVTKLRSILGRITISDSGRFIQVDGSTVPW